MSGSSFFFFLLFQHGKVLLHQIINLEIKALLTFSFSFYLSSIDCMECSGREEEILCDEREDRGEYMGGFFVPSHLRN